MNSKTPWLTPSEALNRPFDSGLGNELIDDDWLELEATRQLGFHISNIGLLISPHITSELTDVRTICAIPNTAPWLLGLINLRGNLVPVFDINMLLQLEDITDKKRMLLILGEGDGAGAILINGLPMHITLSIADKLDDIPPLPEALKPYTPVAYDRNGEVWFSFDHVGFFQSLASRIAL
ncbi:MAG: hypothetical protein BWK78_05425 [Thiotrichaceae bacterium IS1]|nr:MAG: hypothetical protein BWK78_05425 [Thiotrichaceae bacterium IS1]